MHKELQLKDIPGIPVINQWRKRGKPRPYTPSEVDLENPETITPASLTPAKSLRDAAYEAGPSDVLPAPVPKKRRSYWAAPPATTAPSVAATAEDQDAASEEDLRNLLGGSVLSVPGDETATSEYYDPGYSYYRAEDDIDDQTVDQMDVEHEDGQHS